MEQVSAVRTCKKTASQICRIPVLQIEGRKQTREICFARHLAMYLVRLHTDLSAKRIAQLFHKLDHTAVLHAVKVIEGHKSRNGSEEAQRIDEAEKRLQLGIDGFQMGPILSDHMIGLLQAALVKNPSRTINRIMLVCKAVLEE